MLDARRVLFMIVGGLIAFFVFMAIAFYLYPIINPDAEYEGGTIGALGYNPVDFSEFGPQVVAELKNRVSDLERQLDVAVKKNIDFSEQIEEMNTKMTEGVSPDAGDNSMLAGDFQTIDPITGMPAGTVGFGAPSDSVIKKVKAMFALDEDELQPIVNMMNDSQLMEIYQQASNRQREQLLRTLSPPKAVALLKKVMS
jgi:hypothetical protein